MKIKLIDMVPDSVSNGQRITFEVLNDADEVCCTEDVVFPFEYSEDDIRAKLQARVNQLAGQYEKAQTIKSKNIIIESE